MAIRFLGLFFLLTCLGLPLGAAQAAEEGGRLRLVFACAADNDLYRVTTSGGDAYPRYDAPAGRHLR